MNTVELIKTNEFFQENRPFFEAGVLRLVYSGDTFCICNMCNYAYVTFDLVKIPSTDTRHGLRTTINQVKAMVDDNGYYIRWLDHLYQNNTWQMRLVALDEPTLNWMKNLKTQTDASGPSTKVDPGLESWIYQRNMNMGR